MKTNSILRAVLFGSLFVFSSCGQDYINNSRVFVEGQITSQSQPAGNLDVRLEDGYYILSKTKTLNDGSFRLGGPDTTSETELSLDKKIKSFKTDVLGCVLSVDSLSIILPDDKQYVKFSNITLY